jgi:hypothetical protein
LKILTPETLRFGIWVLGYAFVADCGMIDRGWKAAPTDFDHGFEYWSDGVVKSPLTPL